VLRLDLKDFKPPGIALARQHRARAADVRRRLRGLVARSGAGVGDGPAGAGGKGSDRHAAAAVLLPQRPAAHEPILVQVDGRTP
jgi:hypothetical protein